MRIAFIVGHLPRRRELASGPLDAEWIVDSRDRIDPVVFTDYQGDGTDLLEEAGVPVNVSSKRTSLFADGTYQTAEEIQARLLLDLHLEAPFDTIIHDSARSLDWSWHQPRLADLPRGVALGAGAVRDLRLVTADAGLFVTHGRRLWSATGPMAAADFLVSDVDPAVYGLAAERLPPCYRLGEANPAATGAEVSALVAVVAMSEDPAGFATLVARAAAAVPTDEATVFAVIHPDIPSQRESTRDMILDGLPDELVSRVRLAEPSSDGVAEGLLNLADVVVAARTSDLAVGAVAEAASKVGAAVLEPAAASLPALTRESLTKAGHPNPRLVPMEGPRAEVIAQIDALQDETAAVILHAPEAAELAQRMWRLPGLSSAGLVLACDAGPHLGDAIPSRPAFNLLGFRTASWPSIRRLMSHTDTLHALVEAVADLSHAGRTDLLCLPVRDVSHGSLTSHHRPLPAWITDDGMLPPPNLAGLSDGTGPVAETSGGADTVRRWAETHGIGDRLRLALPWKWGLLNRAMKGRW